jgi:hypothetical protein
MRLATMLAGTLVLLTATAPGFGQALAEGAMVHANAAAAGAKAGSSIGNALNRANARNAQSLHAATSGAVSAGKIQNVPQSKTPGTSARGGDSAGPFIITSIQGVRKPCTSAPAAAPTAAVSTSSVPTAPAPAAPVAAATAPVAPLAPPQSRDCGTQSRAGESKSVINLTFSQ